MKLSIVATLFKSENSIDDFCRRVLASAESVSDDLELVLVNDGSPDESLNRALAIAESDPRVVIVDLSRNFGHHKAIMTGLEHATGELIFLIDSDLEEEPEMLGLLYEKFRESECDVVYAVQAQRKGGFVERVTGSLFYWATHRLTDAPLPRNVMTARLMSRRYVEAVIRFRDHEFFLANLFTMAGFSQVAVPIRKLSVSPTTYSLSRRVSIAVRYITTNSTKLLHLIFWAGLLISSCAALAIVYLIVKYFVAGVGVDGWTSVIVSVWFFGGAIVLILGILGIYIANILIESKERPYTIVRHVYRARGSAGPGERPDSRPNSYAGDEV